MIHERQPRPAMKHFSAKHYDATQERANRKFRKAWAVSIPSDNPNKILYTADAIIFSHFGPDEEGLPVRVYIPFPQKR